MKPRTKPCAKPCADRARDRAQDRARKMANKEINLVIGKKRQHKNSKSRRLENKVGDRRGRPRINSHAKTIK